MAIQRITQSMMSQGSLAALQGNLNRLASLQEQLSTGRLINRPSDDPSGAAAAMRMRSSLTDTAQHGRNAADAVSWLQTIDSALNTANSQVQRARDLALQGANSGAMGPGARAALVAELEQIRSGLVDTANSAYMGRPVFGGITGGGTAYSEDASGAIVFSGDASGQVQRTIADGVKLRVDMPGAEPFGPDGSSVFDHLDELITALNTGDDAALQAVVGLLADDSTRIVNAQAASGTRHARALAAVDAVVDRQLTLRANLSEIENADLPQIIVDLQMQQVAYQAALGATARVMQPSLLDFLR